MTDAIRISVDHARRFLVRRHLLDPPRSLPARAASVLRVIDRLGSLQFDPLEVPGARSHDLVLHARIRNYRRPWLDRWLYSRGQDRQLIEFYNKSLNILPMAEVPYYRYSWDRWRHEYEDGILTEHADLAQSILDRIDQEGELATDAFRDVDHRVSWWWDNSDKTTTRAAKAIMESYFVIGRLGIARREGNRRYYDLIERLVPPNLLAQKAPVADQQRHRLLSRYRGVGLMAATGDAMLTWGTAPPADRARLHASLVDNGTVVPLAIEGVRETRYLLGVERSIFDETASPSRRIPAVAFIAPLDQLMWDRRLVGKVFGFEYKWEVYVPEPKRRWGYYVLPILFGDRLVGRIEPKLDRPTRTLNIIGIWFEDGFSPMEEPHFVPALSKALAAYRSFIGADGVRWPTTGIGRDLAQVVGSPPPS